MNRRTFVSTLAAAGMAAATSSKLSAASSKALPKVGLIGCGWYGGLDMHSIAKVAKVEIVSLCDVNQKALQKTLGDVAKLQTRVPQTYTDYRKMIAAEKHDIVVVGTPDHWHALPAIEAMKAGADVFIEKPISVDVIEGEALVAAARKYKRVVQVNLQRRSLPHVNEVKEKYVKSGRLGRIGLVECHYYGGGNSKVIPETEAPAHLDYEMWAGPAPKLPYMAPMEARGWRAFMEFGNGYIGDMGVHIFDTARYLMDLSWPEQVSASGGIYMHKDGTSNRPDTHRAVFHYPDLDVSWEHRMWGQSPIPQRHWTDQWGLRIIGEKGTLSVGILGYEFEPKGKGPKEGVHLMSKTGDRENVDFEGWDDKVGEGDALHAADFMKARESRSRSVSDIEEGHISSACCILGNLSIDLRRPLAYDPKTRTVPGDEEATARLSRPYRGNWIHPDPMKV